MPKNETTKILIWKSKHGHVYVSARDDAEEQRAYLYLFKMMDDIGYYSYDGALNADEKVWYKAAKAGSGQAARWLVGNRFGEYEEVETEYAMVP